MQMLGKISIASISLSAALLPAVASAQILTRVSSLFNIFVGIMLAIAFVIYGTGFVVWVTRLGVWPSYRTEGVKITEWSVAVLFVLFVLLLVVRYFKDHPVGAAAVFAIVVILLFVWMIIYIMQHSKEKKEEKKP